MNKDDLRTLPGTPQEQAWLRERLETLSVREETVLAAAMMRHPPESIQDAINYLQSLDSYGVCFPAGSYEQLGELCLCREVQSMCRPAARQAIWPAMGVNLSMNTAPRRHRG